MSSRPVSLLVAAVAVGLEGITALLLGAYVAVRTVTDAPPDVVTSVVVAAFGVLYGVGLLWVTRGLLTAARWSRAPGVVTQILLIPVVVTLTQAGRPELGVPLAAVALAALGALLAPPTTRAMYGDDAGRAG